MTTKHYYKPVDKNYSLSELPDKWSAAIEVKTGETFIGGEAFLFHPDMVGKTFRTACNCADHGNHAEFTVEGWTPPNDQSN